MMTFNKKFNCYKNIPLKKEIFNNNLLIKNIIILENLKPKIKIFLLKQFSKIFSKI